MTNIALSVFLFLVVSSSFAANSQFSVIDSCDGENCNVIRNVDGKEGTVVVLSRATRIGEIKKLDSDMYYFHISCGSPCGYGHYVTPKQVYITTDNEILFDKERKCLIEAKDNKILQTDFKTTETRVIFDFAQQPKYQSDIYKEILDFAPLYMIFKEDAYIDKNNTLHLFSFGKEAEGEQIRLDFTHTCS